MFYFLLILNCLQNKDLLVTELFFFFENFFHFPLQEQNSMDTISGDIYCTN